MISHYIPMVLDVILIIPLVKSQFMITNQLIISYPNKYHRVITIPIAMYL